MCIHSLGNTLPRYAYGYNKFSAVCNGSRKLRTALVIYIYNIYITTISIYIIPTYAVWRILV